MSRLEMNPITGKCSTCGDFARDCVCDGMPFIEEVFTIDGHVKAVGLHDPDVRWNGWACPMFPIESVRIIAEWVASWAEDGESYEVISVEGEKVFSIYRDGDIVEREEVLPFNVDGVDYFEIGSHGWIWDVWEGEEV